MTAKLRFLWARLTANYWFYPALFSLLAAMLALALVWLDRSGATASLNDAGWLIPARPSGAADMLTVMAGSMIGVASTVFSITLVAVTFSSGSYGPRLITNFLEDRGNQISLATFIASFVYAIVVLRAVHAPVDPPPESSAEAMAGFVPQLSLLVAYAMMAASVGVLVFFLHHIPASIQINTVLEGIGNRLLTAIRDTYPIEDEAHDAREQIEGEPIRAARAGYVQLIDFTGLEKVAHEHDCTLSLKVRTGDFVHRDLPLLEVAGASPDAVEGALRLCFTLGAARTPEQDPQFLIDELVEIGLRALSPGINDPFTAITALHWLGAAISEIGRRDLRKDVGSDEKDDSPVIPQPDDFAHYVKRGFGAIRSGVASAPIAAEVMFDTLRNAAVPITDPQRRELLREEGRLLAQQAQEHLSGPALKKVEEEAARYDRSFWQEG